MVPFGLTFESHVAQVWMALPIFTTQLYTAQALVLLVSAAPALYVLRARMNEGKWLDYPPQLLNIAWVPSEKDDSLDAAVRVAGGPDNIDASVWRALPIAALVFVGIWGNQTDLGRCKHAPVLTLTRADAISAAAAELSKIHPDFVGYNASSSDGIPGGWRVITSVLATQAVEDLFVFDSDTNAVHCGPTYSPLAGPDSEPSSAESVYAQQMSSGFLVPPHWSVRMARFDVDCDLDVSERAEELSVGVA